MSKPWFKFSPSAWKGDDALRMCSLAARGLWVELLCVMDQAEPRGHLLVGGQRPSPKQIAMLVGIDGESLLPLLRELEAHDVFSRKRDGTIFSRKMVRETRISLEQSARVSKRYVKESTGDLDLGDTKENREQSPDVREIANAIWDESPSIARKRSSKLAVEKAVRAAVHRGKNPAVIRRAVVAYYADPEVCREDHKFAKGVHRVVQADFWETWAEAEGVEHLPTDRNPQFRFWMEDWLKNPLKWRRERGPAPDEPGCKIPADIMAEFDFVPPAHRVTK